MNIKQKVFFFIRSFGVVPFLVVLIVLTIYSYHAVCRNKFGTEFNVKRRELKIPIIPPTWKMKQRDFDMTWWTGKDLIIGHEGKRIIFSGCEIDEEVDDYFFSLQQIQGKTLQVRYKYINSNRKKDSISFSYQVGNFAKYITKQQADSIFKANKITKDY